MIDSPTNPVASRAQPGVFAGAPQEARYLTFTIHAPEHVHDVLAKLRESINGTDTVLGIGFGVAAALRTTVDGLRVFQARQHADIDIPSTPGDLWLWLRERDGGDRGDLMLTTHRYVSMLAPAFKLLAAIDAFKHGSGRDLTGYQDGIENPTGDDAIAAAIVSGKGPALDGSSFVAVQQWLHDMDRFGALSPSAQDDSVGRRKLDSEELPDAPASAHVKRTAQESFAPEAFMLRRSMPWASATDMGLMFVAFGNSFYAFEAQLRRMIGMEDDVIDGIFQYTKPVTGNYYWCPPMIDGRPNLSLLGL